MTIKSNLVQRSITGILFGAAVVGSILYSEWSYFALLFVINFLCLKEFYELVLPDKSWIEKYLGIIAGCVILLMFMLIFSADLSLAWYYHLIPVFLVMMVIKLFEKTHTEFGTLAFQVLGLFYITMPIVMFAKMGFFNSVEYSPGLPMGFLMLLWIADIGAYVTGSLIGKHKLFFRISPGKTWEGSAGALLFAVAMAFWVAYLFDDVTRRDWIIISVIVLVFSTLGDLFESLLKRNLAIKDSGHILPGHGGILDRFDGLFLAVPAVFFYLMLTN